MDLSEVEKSMVPGAEQVLKTGIGLDAGIEAFQIAAIKVAVEQSPNQSVAARRLGIKQETVSQVMNGQRLTRYRGRGKKTAEQK